MIKYVTALQQIAVAFRTHHDSKEEFRSNKVMHSKLRDLQPDLFLPQAVESNPNKKLVNGQPYEDILYYKEAALYSPTYYLMMIVAELFWSAGRASRFLTPMLYAYLRSFSGHQTNWVKAILHSLPLEIISLQTAARPKITRRWSHMTKECDITLSGLEAKFPHAIVDVAELHEKCQLPEDIPVAAVHKDGSSEEAIQPRNVSRSRATGMANNKVSPQRNGLTVQPDTAALQGYPLRPPKAGFSRVRITNRLRIIRLPPLQAALVVFIADGGGQFDDIWLVAFVKEGASQFGSRTRWNWFWRSCPQGYHHGNRSASSKRYIVSCQDKRIVDTVGSL
ncbi:hypothetical protein R1sor_002882 [Riccia sorocarpa]|uniref:Uncharacterized protein n=1 Tax=Riccia sorocarpa TaxID=122646 RepID=A0ABD3H392_9MARC